jgi:hypothetical protein
MAGERTIGPVLIGFENILYQVCQDPGTRLGVCAQDAITGFDRASLFQPFNWLILLLPMIDPPVLS